MANEKRLIDANALLNWLEECTDENDWLVSQYSAGWIWSMLDSAPTVDAVEVVHGRWAKQIEDGMYWYECSECGGEVPKTRYKHDWYSIYCPNCGAKMDGGNEDA